MIKYNLKFFTCDVDFPVWRHYLRCHRDVIIVKNFHEILNFILLLTKLLFWGEAWALGYKSMHF